MQQIKHFYNWATESRAEPVKKSIWAEESRAEMVLGRGVQEPQPTYQPTYLPTYLPTYIYLPYTPRCGRWLNSEVNKGKNVWDGPLKLFTRSRSEALALVSFIQESWRNLRQSYSWYYPVLSSSQLIQVKCLMNGLLRTFAPCLRTVTGLLSANNARFPWSSQATRTYCVFKNQGPSWGT